MRKNWKKILYIYLCLGMLFGLCACDTSDIWVFSLNGEKLYEKDVATFAYIYVAEHNIQDREQLKDLYENSETYEELYKKALEDEIISTTLLYKEAKDRKIKLSGEEKELIQKNVENVVERFGIEALEKNEVSETDLERVYEMRMLGQLYVDSLSTTENDLDDSEKDGEHISDERYVKVYQVTFPTVELDANGMVRTDAEGNLITIPSSQMSAMKLEAADFAENAKNNGDMETLVESCSETVSGVEKYLKYEDLSSNYKKAIDALNAGEVSDVLEEDYGYYVIRLIEKDDKEYAQSVAEHQQETDVLALEQEELDRLYSEYAQENKGYKNSSMWEMIDIENYMKD